MANPPAWRAAIRTLQPGGTSGATCSFTAAPGQKPALQSRIHGAKRWLAPPEVKEATLTLDLAKEDTISGIGFDEPDVWPRMRQQYRIEARQGATWTTIAQGTTVGHGVVQDVPSFTASAVRITLVNDRGGPGVAELMLFRPE